MADSAMFMNYGTDFSMLGGTNIGGALPGLGGHGDVQVFDVFHGGLHDAMTAIDQNLPLTGALPGLGGPTDVHLIGSDGHDYALHYDPHTAMVHMPNGKDVSFSQHDYQEFMAAETSKVHDQYAAFHVAAKHGNAAREFYGGATNSFFVGKYLDDGRFQMLDGRVFDYLPSNAIPLSAALTHGHYTPITKPDHPYDALGNYLLDRAQTNELDLNALDPAHAKLSLDLNDLNHLDHDQHYDLNQLDHPTHNQYRNKDDTIILELERDLKQGWKIQPDGSFSHHGPLPLNPDGNIDISGLSELPIDQLPKIILPEEPGWQKFDWASTMPPGWSHTTPTVDHHGTEHVKVTAPDGSILRLTGSKGIYEVGDLIPAPGSNGPGKDDTSSKLIQQRHWIQIDKDWQPSFDSTYKDGARELVVVGPKGEVLRLDDRDGYLGVRSITPGVGQVLPDDGERIGTIPSIPDDVGIGGGQNNLITLTDPIHSQVNPSHSIHPIKVPHHEFLTSETRAQLTEFSHQMAQNVGKAAIATAPFLIPLLMAPI